MIPEAEALRNEDDNAVLGAREGIIRVVLSVLCLGLDSSEVVRSPTQRDDVFSDFSPSTVCGRVDMKPSVKWAGGLLCQWYKAGDDLPWKTVLEKTLPQIVSRPSFVFDVSRLIYFYKRIVR